MAAAPNGTASIAYSCETNECLKVVTCKGGVCWPPEIPDPTTLMNGSYSSMALSRSQQPNISYMDIIFKGVKLAIYKDMVYLPALRK